MPDILNLFVNLRTIFITVLLGLCIYYLIVIANKKVGRRNAIRITKKGLIKLLIVMAALVAVYKIISVGGFIIDLAFIIFICLIAAYILNPLVNFLQKKKLKRPMAIGAVYLGIVLVIVVLFMTIGPRIMEEGNKLVQQFPSYASKLYNVLKDLYDQYADRIQTIPGVKAESDIDKQIADVVDAAKDFITYLVGDVATAVWSFFSKLFNVVLIPIITFYILKDKDIYKDRIIKLIPWKKRDEVVMLGREVDDVIGRYIRGQLGVCVFIGVATAIALSILGIDFAVIIGIIAGVFNIIPYLGPIIGLIPALIFALLDEPIKAVWVTVAIVIIQQVESNFITPRILGKSVGLPPLVVMLSVLISGSYFGILGMLLAVPAVSVARIMYRFAKIKVGGVEEKEIFPTE